MDCRPRKRRALLPALARGEWTRAVAAGLLLLLTSGQAHGAGRSVLLNYICTSYESARQVAITQGWETAAPLPADCRLLIGQRIENRLAVVIEIVEVFRLPSSRWVEIGRVQQPFGPVSYSAGFADQSLPLVSRDFGNFAKTPGRSSEHVFLARKRHTAPAPRRSAHRRIAHLRA